MVPVVATVATCFNPTFRMFIDAFKSLSISNPHSSQWYVRSDKLKVSLTQPQLEQVLDFLEKLNLKHPNLDNDVNHYYEVRKNSFKKKI